MNTRLAIVVIWTLSGALLIKLAAAWPTLPERVATHFGARLQPDGWGSKRALAAMILIAVLGQAALATFVLLRVDIAASPAGVVLLVVNVALVSALWQTINYNAKGTQITTGLDVRSDYCAAGRYRPITGAEIVCVLKASRS